MCRGGALGAGLDDEVLVVAGEPREEVQHLRTATTTPSDPGGPGRMVPGRAGTYGEVGSRGRRDEEGEGHGASERGAVVAEAEDVAAEHLALAELLRRRRRRRGRGRRHRRSRGSGEGTVGGASRESLTGWSHWRGGPERHESKKSVLEEKYPESKSNGVIRAGPIGPLPGLISFKPRRSVNSIARIRSDLLPAGFERKENTTNKASSISLLFSS